MHDLGWACCHAGIDRCIQLQDQRSLAPCMRPSERRDPRHTWYDSLYLLPSGAFLGATVSKNEIFIGSPEAEAITVPGDKQNKSIGFCDNVFWFSYDKTMTHYFGYGMKHHLNGWTSQLSNSNLNYMIAVIMLLLINTLKLLHYFVLLGLRL